MKTEKVKPYNDRRGNILSSGLSLSQQFLCLLGQDYVVVITTMGDFRIRSVTWLNGIPYSYNYHKDDKTALMNNGGCEDNRSIERWEPITGNMKKYYSS